MHAVGLSGGSKSCVEARRDMVRGWFYDVDLDQIQIENLQHWVLWACFDKAPTEFVEQEREEVNDLLDVIQDSIQYKLSEGYNPNIKSIRVSIDPVRSQSRPFICYLIVLFLRGIGELFATYLGFQYRSLKIGETTLPYYFRPGSESW